MKVFLTANGLFLHLMQLSEESKGRSFGRQNLTLIGDKGKDNTGKISIITIFNCNHMQGIVDLFFSIHGVNDLAQYRARKCFLYNNCEVISDLVPNFMGNTKGRFWRNLGGETKIIVADNPYDLPMESTVIEETKLGTLAITTSNGEDQLRNLLNDILRHKSEDNYEASFWLFGGSYLIGESRIYRNPDYEYQFIVYDGVIDLKVSCFETDLMRELPHIVHQAQILLHLVCDHVDSAPRNIEFNFSSVVSKDNMFEKINTYRKYSEEYTADEMTIWNGDVREIANNSKFTPNKTGCTVFDWLPEMVEVSEDTLAIIEDAPLCDEISDYIQTPEGKVPAYGFHYTKKD